MQVVLLLVRKVHKQDTKKLCYVLMMVASSAIEVRKRHYFKLYKTIRFLGCHHFITPITLLLSVNWIQVMSSTVAPTRSFDIPSGKLTLHLPALPNDPATEPCLALPLPII